MVVLDCALDSGWYIVLSIFLCHYCYRIRDRSCLFITRNNLVLGVGVVAVGGPFLVCCILEQTRGQIIIFCNVLLIKE